MKKALLLIINLLFAQAVFAYQTVLVDFPPNQGWHSVVYQATGGEAILQYVPVGQNEQQWTRTVVFHSYKDLTWTDSSARLLDQLTQQLELKNSSQQYRYIKYTDADAIATRCVQKNAYIPTQCEILRTSQSFDGLITMHYINKDVNDFKSTYNMWYQIIAGVRIYYSYYMDDAILNKATSFEM